MNYYINVVICHILYISSQNKSLRIRRVQHTQHCSAAYYNDAVRRACMVMHKK